MRISGIAFSAMMMTATMTTSTMAFSLNPSSNASPPLTNNNNNYNNYIRNRNKHDSNVYMTSTSMEFPEEELEFMGTSTSTSRKDHHEGSSMSITDKQKKGRGKGMIANANTIANGPLEASTLAIPAIGEEEQQEVVDDDNDDELQALASAVFSEKEQRPIVLFDGVCNLCDATVNFCIDHDVDAKLRFCSLQSKTADALLVDAYKNSNNNNDNDNAVSTTTTTTTKMTDSSNEDWKDKIVICLPQSKYYFGSEAVAHICQRLDPWPFQLFGKIGQYTPKILREPIYALVSHHRHFFGENDSCRMDFDGIYETRFISDPPSSSSISSSSS